MMAREGERRQASTKATGTAPRATATAAPTMCRIRCSMNDCPENTTCRHTAMMHFFWHDDHVIIPRFNCESLQVMLSAAPDSQSQTYGPS